MDQTIVDKKKCILADQTTNILPFAISDESQTQSLFGLKMSSLGPFDNSTNEYNDSDLSCLSLSPDLASSITSETQGSSISASLCSHENELFEQSSLSDTCTIASIRTSILGELFHLPKSSDSLKQDMSINFSELMDFADNTNEINTQFSISSAEELVYQTPSSQLDEASQTFMTKKSVDELPFESFYTTEKMNSKSNSDEQDRLILSSLTSITPLERANENIKSIEIDNTLIDANSFEIAANINSSCSLRDAMNILGNPNFLQLWCDSVQEIIVIKSSEGAHNDNDQYNQQEHLREYECEWIEAIALDIVSPSKNSGYLHNTSRAMWSFMGFPSYGKVTMLVERQRGKIGITIGPFAGMITASHTITIHEEGGNIKVVNRVQLGREEERSYDYLGISKSVESCILPTIDSYMNQVASSMRKLCHLIRDKERGQRVGATLHAADSLTTPLLLQ